MVSPNSSAELYNLRWNSYLSNLVNVFSDHQAHESLVDVTLSCEGSFIRAHKLVLSACSLYFQKVFQIHTCSPLVIVLNDVKLKDLQLIVQFMYKGEVKVADGQLQDFLSLGKLLQVKGLCSVEFKGNKVSTANDKETEQPEADKQEAPTIDKESPKKEQSRPDPEIPPKKRKLSPEQLPEETAAKNEEKSVMAPKKVDPPPKTPDYSNIRRPPNAFMIFANQWRRKLALEYPNESNKDISVRLGNMWKSLSQETKDQFYEDARKAEEEHQKKYPGYCYSPKEARNRKVNGKDDGKKSGRILQIEINDSNPDLIEIKDEPNDS